MVPEHKYGRSNKIEELYLNDNSMGNI